MNKKTLLLLPLLSLILSGCVMHNGKDLNEDTSDSITNTTTQGIDQESNTSTSTSSEGNTSTSTPPSPISTITTYLVLGEYGLYKGNKGNDIASLFLENTIVYEANSGSILPGKDDVTSSVNNSVFEHWQAYEGDGSTKEYTTVPDTNSKILYAVFSGGSGSGSSSSGDSDTPTPGGGDTLPTSGYGLLFTDNSYALGTLLTELDPQGRPQYLISNYQFYVNDEFKIYDFANKSGWVENLEGYSFGGSSETDTEWTSYLDKGTNSYTVKVDFKANVYLKLAWNNNGIYFGLV